MADPLRTILHAFRRLPLWARWLTTIVAYLVVIAIVVLIVHNLTSEGASSSRRSEAAAVAEANKVGKVAVAEDEAPHSARLAAGAAVRPTLQAMIAADVKRRIAHGELTGPLQTVHCASLGSGPRGALLFRCTVESAGIAYEFRGVANTGQRQLTWCKVDRAPEGDAALEVSLAASCVR